MTSRRAALVVAVIAVAAGCSNGGGSDATPSAREKGERRVEPSTVRACLTSEGHAPADLPLSDSGTVLAVDFGSNSVQVYLEPDEDAVQAEARSIRRAEDEVGNTGTSRVVIRTRGTVLVSWANEPDADQRAVIRRCVGFA